MRKYRRSVDGSLLISEFAQGSIEIAGKPLHPFGVLRNLLLRNLDSKKATI